MLSTSAVPCLVHFTELDVAAGCTGWHGSAAPLGAAKPWKCRSQGPPVHTTNTHILNVDFPGEGEEVFLLQAVELEDLFGPCFGLGKYFQLVFSWDPSWTQVIGDTRQYPKLEIFRRQDTEKNCHLFPVLKKKIEILREKKFKIKLDYFFLPLQLWK